MKKKSRSNNPEGRPTEYESERQKVLVSLPKDYLRWLDSLAELHCSSRSRLLNEHLLLVQALTLMGFFEIDESGTEFKSIPNQKRGKKKNDETSNGGWRIKANRDRVTTELFDK